MERHYLLQRREDISKMDRNKSKASEQQELQMRASHSHGSSAPFPVLKGKGMPLESFQSLTFESEHSQEFKTSQDVCFYLYNPQTSQYSIRKTQTEIQSQTEEFSHRQEQIYFNTPLQFQHDTPLSHVQNIYITDIQKTEQEEEVNPLQQTKYRANDKSSLEEEEEERNNSHAGETECKLLFQPPSKLTASGSVTDQTELTAPLSTMAVCSCGATSVDQWEQSFQQDNTQFSAPKYPSTVYEPNFVQHLKMYPPWDISVSPQACRNQDATVSSETVNDHIERVSGSDMETHSTGCAGTKTPFHLCRCSKSKGSSNMNSNCVKGLKQATATSCCLCAPKNTCQGSTPLGCSTVPIQSITRSTNGSSSSNKGRGNPSSQCHQFLKLPFPPPCSGLQGLHLNQSEDDYPSDTPRKAEKRWMLLEQDQRLGSGLGLQQASFLSGLNRDDRTYDNSKSNFIL